MSRNVPRWVAAALAVTGLLVGLPADAGVQSRTPAAPVTAPEDSMEVEAVSEEEAASEPVTAGEPEPGCPFPALRPPALPPVFVHLAQAMATPRAVAAELTQALNGPGAREAVFSRYCPSRQAPTATEDGCASAMASLSPDGSIRYRSPREDSGVVPGRFCLTGSKEAWGAMALVRVAGRGSDPALCFEAVPGTTYELASTLGSYATLRVWADRRGAALEKARKAAEATASDVLAAAYKARVFRLWGHKLGAAGSVENARDLLAELSNELRTELRKHKGPALTAAQKGVTEALGALAEDADTLLAESSESFQSVARLCNYASPAPYARDDGPVPLELRARQEEPAPGAALVALRDLAAASPRSGGTLPWTVFEGELPTRATSSPLAVHAERGREEPQPAPFEGEEVVAFVHDLVRANAESTGHTVSFLRGARVQARPSDLALIASTVIAVAEDVVRSGAVGPLGGLGLRLPRSRGDEDLFPQCRAVLCRKDDEADPECMKRLESAIPAAHAVWSRTCRVLVRELPLTEPDHLAVAAAVSELLALQPAARWTTTPEAAGDELVRNLDARSLDRLLAEPLGPVRAEPTARFTSRVLVSSLEGGRMYELKVCRGVRDCDARTPSTSVSASVSFPVRQPHRVFSTVTELAWSGGNPSMPLGGYSQAAVGGAATAGGEQLYELRGSEGWGDRVSFSQLLAFYPFGSFSSENLQGLGLGVGPTFATGAGFDLFKQWNFRFLWEPPFARGFVLSMGPSVRLVDEPVDRIGTVVAGKPDSAPEVAVARTAPVWLFSVGAAVDLGVVGAETVGAVKSLFASKPSQADAAASEGGEVSETEEEVTE